MSRIILIIPSLRPCDITLNTNSFIVDRGLFLASRLLQSSRRKLRNRTVPARLCVDKSRQQYINSPPEQQFLHCGTLVQLRLSRDLHLFQYMCGDVVPFVS